MKAYKGASGVPGSNNDVLTAALPIHHVGACHAAHIRDTKKAGTDVKPWITPAGSGIPKPYDFAGAHGYKVKR